VHSRILLVNELLVAWEGAAASRPTRTRRIYVTVAGKSLQRPQALTCCSPGVIS